MQQSSDEKKQKPCNYVAEREVLGALQINNDLLLHVSDILKPEHFFEPLHQRIYAAIVELWHSGETANPITLKNKFDQDAALTDIGGAAYLVKLAASSSPILNAKDYAITIYRDYQRRELIDRCEKTIADSYDADNKNPDEIAARLSSFIQDMASTDKRKVAYTDKQVTEQIIEQMLIGDTYYSTGLNKLDQCMYGGLYPSKQYAIAAWTKVGKTVMASTISRNLARQGVKHLFICGEMNPAEIHKRVIATDMGLDPKRFIKPNQDLISKVRESIEQYNGHALYQNAPGLTFDDLKQYMARAVYQDKVKGIILDYWQLVGGQKPRQPKAEHLKEVSQWMADFGKEHNIFTLITAQRNKDGAVAESTGLDRSADQLYFLQRDDISSPYAWMEMIFSRYTPVINIGSQDYAGLYMEGNGPHFKEL